MVTVSNARNRSVQLTTGKVRCREDNANAIEGKTLAAI